MMTSTFSKVTFSRRSPSTRRLEELGRSKEPVSCGVVLPHQRAWFLRERKVHALLLPLLRQLG